MTGFVFRNQLETIRHFGVFQTAIDRDHHEFVGVRDVMHSGLNRFHGILHHVVELLIGLCQFQIFVGLRNPVGNEGASAEGGRNRL